MAALIWETLALGYCSWNHLRVLGRQPSWAVMLPPKYAMRTSFPCFSLA